jgi:hypothetical protein
MCAVQLHSTSEATVGTEEAPRLLYGVDRFVLFFSPNLNRFMSVISPSGRNPRLLETRSRATARKSTDKAA